MTRNPPIVDELIITDLVSAIQCKAIGWMEMLLDNGANPNALHDIGGERNGMAETVLEQYQDESDAQFVKDALHLLIKHGLDTSRAHQSSDNIGDAPLLNWLVMTNEKEKINLLLEAGLDIESLDGDGDTPLACSLWLGYGDIAVLLLKKGADIKRVPNLMARARDGNTMMESNDLLVIEKLLSEQERECLDQNTCRALSHRNADRL